MTADEIAGLIGVVASHDLFPMPTVPHTPGALSRPSGGLAKAFIDIEGGEKLQCWFNPNRYTISKSNKWDEQPVVGTSLPQVQFGGGQARKLSLELFFDDSDNYDGDVKRITDRLFAAMEVNDAFQSSRNTARPPLVEFGWGQTWTFKAVIEQLSVDFILFRPDGVPVRAIAKLDLRQAEQVVGGPATPDAKRQNPTTLGMAGLGAKVVREGDSLQSMAFAAYRDATSWRAIAEANGIDDPTRLIRGASLAIPRLSE